MLVSGGTVELGLHWMAIDSLSWWTYIDAVFVSASQEAW